MSISQTTLPPWITPTLPTGYRTGPSGLLVPSLTVPGAGGLVTAEAADLDRIPELVAQQHAELQAKFGAPAADAIVGAELQIADTAAAEIEQDRIVAALMNGDLAGTVAAASH